MAPRITPVFLLSSLALPAATLLISTYLYNAPLSARQTRTIRTSDTLSQTALTSHSLQHIVNPRNHVSATDSRTITLSKAEIGNLTDEEILSRFLRGFYNGWVFYPEKGIISLFRLFGRTMVPVGFTDIPTNGPQIVSPADISRTSLPEKFTVLLGGNFMVLDLHLNLPSPFSSPKEQIPSPSFVEIGFGDDRRGFAGMHRFEVLRGSNSANADEEGDGVTELCYSSISCNPTVNKLPFPRWVFGFHKFYAQSLFRDGVAEVLRD